MCQNDFKDFVHQIWRLSSYYAENVFKNIIFLVEINIYKYFLVKNILKG